MKKWIIVATGVLLLGVAYLQFRSNKIKPFAPKVPVVTSCKELKPGMRRIGEQYGIQFDVPAKDFIIHEGWTDAPPLIHGFDLRLKDSASSLGISWGPLETTKESMGPIDPILSSFSHIEKRKIFNDKGKQIGGDSWGYLDNGTRWRRVHLVVWVVASYGSDNEKDVASYGSVHEEDAKLFDQVISSVCYLSASGS